MPLDRCSITPESMTLDYTHVSSPADPADCTALLATWLERRLDSTTSWELDEARLYGITIRDGALLVEDADTAALGGPRVRGGGALASSVAVAVPPDS